MGIIDFLNSYSDVIQICLGAVSIAVSVVLSVLIFRLQRAHEKQISAENERRRSETLSESAKVFLIDNQEEVGYLPLCVMAASVHKYAPHNRHIYTRFNKCSAELQTEILRQENIPIAVTKDAEWVDECFEKLRSDAEQQQLGQDMLYDRAKYFHRGFERYAAHHADGIDANIFAVPTLSSTSAQWVKQTGNHFDLTLYIDRYLEFVLRDRDDTKDAPEKLPQVPPYDIIFANFNTMTHGEAILSFWVMQIVLATSIAFFRHDIVGKDKAEWRMLTSGDAEIETFEDLYYEALLALYTAYAPKAIL